MEYMMTDPSTMLWLMKMPITVLKFVQSKVLISVLGNVLLFSYHCKFLFLCHNKLSTCFSSTEALDMSAYNLITEEATHIGYNQMLR